MHWPLYPRVKRLGTHCTGGWSGPRASLNRCRKFRPRSPDRPVLQKLTCLHLVKNSPHYTEPERSLPHLQVPATCPYPEPDQSSPRPHFLKIHLNIIRPSTPGSSMWSFFFRFPHQTPIYTSPLPYVLHAPPISLFRI